MFIPDITNTILSFFDFDNELNIKFALRFLSLFRHFRFMNNIYNKDLLENIFHLILEKKIQNYNIKVVENILKIIDPEKYSNYAIKMACHNGHLEIVKLMLKNKKPSYSIGINDGFDYSIIPSLEHPLSRALQADSPEILDLLLQDSRFNRSSSDNYVKVPAFIFISYYYTKHEYHKDYKKIYSVLVKYPASIEYMIENSLQFYELFFVEELLKNCNRDYFNMIFRYFMENECKETKKDEEKKIVSMLLNSSFFDLKYFKKYLDIYYFNSSIKYFSANSILLTIICHEKFKVDVSYVKKIILKIEFKNVGEFKFAEKILTHFSFNIDLPDNFILKMLSFIIEKKFNVETAKELIKKIKNVKSPKLNEILEDLEESINRRYMPKNVIELIIFLKKHIEKMKNK